MSNLKLDMYDFPEFYLNKGNMEKLAGITGSQGLLTKEEINLLPDSDFALVIKEGAAVTRKFPVVDKSHAYASALLFNKTKDELPVSVRNKVAANIVAGISEKPIKDNAVNKADMEAMQKTAAFSEQLRHRAGLVDSDFALVIKVADTKRRMYPIYDEEMCKQAADYFSQNYKAMPVDLRHKFAFSLTNKVASEGYAVELPKVVKSYYSHSFNPNIESELVARKIACQNHEIKSAYELLRHKYSEAHPIKTASILRELDKVAGLQSSKNFSDAYVAVFGTQPAEEKTAQSSGDVTIAGGYTFSPDNGETIKILPYEAMADILPEEAYPEYQDDPATIISALPATHQQRYSDIMNGMG